MLRFFRINDPYRLLFIFLILIVFRIVQGYFVPGTSYYELKWMLLGEWLGEGFTMYDQTYDYTGPIAAMMYKVLDLLFGRSPLVGQILSSIFIIIQAGIFNALLLKNKVYSENSYVPALLYVLLAISVPDFRTLSPQLMSVTFVLLALRNVFRRIGNQVTDELFLSSGLFIGIAAMIYLPSSIFFFVFLFSLILFSTAILRRLLLYFFGFSLVFVLCALYFYMLGVLDLFVSRALMSGMLLTPRVAFTWIEFVKIGAPFAFLLAISVIQKFGSIRMTNFQQKVDQVIWLLFFGGLVTIFVSNERTGSELIFLVPVIAYFWTYYFILLKRRVFKTLMPAILVFGILTFSCYSYRSHTTSLLVNGTDATEHTMVFGEGLEIYAEAKMSTPFLCDPIASEFLTELDEYAGAEKIHFLLTKLEPKVLDDRMNAVEKLQVRYPYFMEKYRKVGPNRYQRISN